MIKRLNMLILTLALLLTMLAVTPVMAKAATKYYETNCATEIKKGPGSDYKREIELPKDAVMIVTSTKNSTWYKVEYQNSKQKVYTGYVKASCLDKAVQYKVTKKGAIRKEGKKSAKVVKSVKKNAKLFVVNTSKKWYKVVYYTGDKVYRGYMTSAKLKKVSSSSSSKTTTKTETKKETYSGPTASSVKDKIDVKYEATTGVNMRAGTSSSASIITVVGTGDVVHVTNTDSNWYKCYYVNSSAKRVVGFIYKDYLKKK